MIRACTMEEYREMVQQALLEVQELEYAAEFDEMAEADNLVPQLRHSLQGLLAKMDDGTYEFSKDTLDFTPLVEEYDVDVLPFRHLLQSLNWTHTEGLDKTGADRAGIEEYA